MKYSISIKTNYMKYRIFIVWAYKGLIKAPGSELRLIRLTAAATARHQGNLPVLGQTLAIGRVGPCQL